jgi:hypothetical protein
MNEKRSEEPGTEIPAERAALQSYLSIESLSAEDKRRGTAHLELITILEQLPKERLPDTVRERLYALEQPTIHTKFFMMGSDTLHPLLFVVGGIAGILLLNSGEMTGQFSMPSMTVLSALFGIVFYDLFKSRFFSL